MTQDEGHQFVTCRTCHAAPGEPCVTRGGREADRVHWGRPRYGERSRHRNGPIEPIGDQESALSDFKAAINRRYAKEGSDS